jgi:hypothetical protein
MINLNSKILTSADQQKERFNICKTCDKYLFGVCKFCGCVLKVKTSFKNQSCPIGNWDEIDEKYETKDEN